MAKISTAYQMPTQVPWIKLGLYGAIMFFGLVIVKKLGPVTSEQYLTNLRSGGGKYVKAITWNVAAINNNPFEYWITNDDPNYNLIMKKVSEFIQDPGANDVLVKDVFTESMYTELETSMKSVGWEGLPETRKIWESDFQNRKIISQFIKDGLLGKKRLASMPDRVTNTVNTLSEGTLMRPTVINCYNSGDVGTIDSWWKQWRAFVFSKNFEMKKNGAATKVSVHQLFSPIKKSKYPSITEEEEKISIPLQTLSLGIFDAILVHMMNTIDAKNWQPLRSDICMKLNQRKNDRTVEILHDTYGDADIQFLQEVAGNFQTFVKTKPLAGIFDIYASASMDEDRDQNSFILLKKGKYKDVTEVTPEVLKEFSKQGADVKVPVVDGDLLAVIATDAADGTKYLLASFHGDTNGLATIPVVKAVHSYATTQRPDTKILFGMDANTYAKPEEDQQGVVDFAQFYTSIKLNSCYGPNPNPQNFTTFHARTHLQPQLNKAITIDEKDTKGDKNPKDFILFFDSDFVVDSTKKDNTGKLKYIEGMVFPTLTFPSDHGITSTILREVPIILYEMEFATHFEFQGLAERQFLKSLLIMDPQIANLLEIAPYDASSGAKLEAHVTAQLTQKTYDFAANKALLKNYQINNDILKIEFVSNVLILSLMRLPSTDFLALTYLIPTKAASHDSIVRIKKCADALERGKFHQFWEEYVGAQAIFAQANGFVDSIRLFILSNLRDTFKTMPKNLFQQQLGLNDSSVVSFCESNKLVEKIAGEDIVFASNDENQNKIATFDENGRIEEGLRLVESLRTSRN